MDAVRLEVGDGDGGGLRHLALQAYGHLNGVGRL